VNITLFYGSFFCGFKQAVSAARFFFPTVTMADVGSHRHGAPRKLAQIAPSMYR
jgi:hypothetical protein